MVITINHIYPHRLMNLTTAPYTVRKKSYSLIAQPPILTAATNCRFHTGAAGDKELETHSSK